MTTVDRTTFDTLAKNFADANNTWTDEMQQARAHAVAAADCEYEMKLREAKVLLNGIEGKNAEERAATLRILLSDDTDYLRYESQHDEHKALAQGHMDDAETARNAMSLARRLMDFEIALLRAAEWTGE